MLVLDACILNMILWPLNSSTFVEGIPSPDCRRFNLRNGSDSRSAAESFVLSFPGRSFVGLLNEPLLAPTDFSLACEAFGTKFRNLYDCKTLHQIHCGRLLSGP